jgi:hypothetical protein
VVLPCDASELDANPILEPETGLQLTKRCERDVAFTDGQICLTF